MITHTHLKLDILECEVKWALGSITSIPKEAEGEGNEGFPPPPDKDLESASQVARACLKSYLRGASRVLPVKDASINKATVWEKRL